MATDDSLQETEEQPADDQTVADRQPLMALFGSPARTKIISVFIAERDHDITISRVAELADIARSTVYDHLDDLLELGVIIETRETGPSTRYQFNADSELAEYCYKLDGVTLRRLYELDGHLEE